MSTAVSTRQFWVDAWSANVGVKFIAAEVHGLKVSKKSRVLEEAKKQTLATVSAIDIACHPVLQGYRDLFSAIHVEAISSPEWLLRVIASHGHLPMINTVVDAYNDVSARTCTVVSAHDLKYVEGDVRIEQTKGTEVFFPLGSKEPETLPADEWAGKADNHILCRLNCKQSDLSKVTLQTTDVLVYVQGNRVTDRAYLENALVEVCESIVHFNGGHYWLLTERTDHLPH